jgi:hypothetical protein
VAHGGSHSTVSSLLTPLEKRRSNLLPLCATLASRPVATACLLKTVYKTLRGSSKHIPELSGYLDASSLVDSTSCLSVNGSTSSLHANGVIISRRGGVVRKCGLCKLAGLTNTF